MEPFLKIGDILASFQSKGEIAVRMDLVETPVKEGETTSATIFSGLPTSIALSNFDDLLNIDPLGRKYSVDRICIGKGISVFTGNSSS